MNKSIRFRFAGILAIVLFLGSACDRTRDTTGWDYFPDMYYSEAYETFTPNPNFADGKTMRQPVPGTIPRDIVPFPYEKTEVDMIRAGKELTNPFGASVENLERGRVLFDRFCVDCHGELGNGKGYLYVSHKYPYPPASLISEKIKKKPDGEIYHTITLGFGVMGAHGPLIRPDDRWKIILYVRTLQDQENQKNP
jgi:mono/diheme cytochrome c family protein